MQRPSTARPALGRAPVHAVQLDPKVDQYIPTPEVTVDDLTRLKARVRNMYQDSFDLMEYRRLKARKAEIDRLQRETKEKAAALAELQAEVERTQLHANINKVKADLSLQNAQSYLHDAEETKKRALEEEEEFEAIRQEMEDALERKQHELEEQLEEARMLQQRLQDEKGEIDFAEIARLQEFERAVLSQMSAGVDEVQRIEERERQAELDRATAHGRQPHGVSKAFLLRIKQQALEAERQKAEQRKSLLKTDPEGWKLFVPHTPDEFERAYRAIEQNRRRLWHESSRLLREWDIRWPAPPSPPEGRRRPLHEPKFRDPPPKLDFTELGRFSPMSPAWSYAQEHEEVYRPPPY